MYAFILGGRFSSLPILTVFRFCFRDEKTDLGFLLNEDGMSSGEYFRNISSSIE